MRLLTNQHQSLDMKHRILFWILLLLQTTAMQGEESSCEVISSESCFYKITGKIKGKIFEQKRPFNVFYSSTTGSKDTAAMFMYAGMYHCEAARGFFCNTEYVNDTFSVSVNGLENYPNALPCTDGNFTFSADGEKDIICKSIQEREGSELSKLEILSQKKSNSDSDSAARVAAWVFGCLGGVMALVFLVKDVGCRFRHFQVRKQAKKEKEPFLQHAVLDMACDKQRCSQEHRQ